MPMYLYFLPLLLFPLLYLLKHHLEQRRAEQIRQHAIEEGLGEPASLHPLIDRNLCIGCKSCVYACPQQLGHNVLGIFHGKAELLEPANCIGHGACKKACPEGAITLVFGTEKRGVDIPNLDDNFETNVPGLFIAGELGGMGLIRNATEQGKSALKAIVGKLPKKSSRPHQVIIVGAGPAGIAATLAAKEKKLKYLTLDQESLGGTVFQYPRGKVVMTQPVDLPLVGKMPFRETTKEKLLQFWEEIDQQHSMGVRYGEMVADISPLNPGFRVKTNKGEYESDTVLLAIGRRGTPRKLGVEGEDLPKVVYRLIDPQQYQGQKVLIVGGGDSALEAALAIADEEGSEVSLSYRSESFSRAKAKNRERIAHYAEEGRIKLYMKSNVLRITESQVELEHDGSRVTIDNDAIIINAGGILPTGFLKKIGIEVETKYGTA